MNLKLSAMELLKGKRNQWGIERYNFNQIEHSCIY